MIVLILLQYRLWVGHGNLPGYWRLKHEVREEQRRVENQEEKNRQLMRDITALKENPDAVEAQARKRLGMIKQGETYYQYLPATAGNE
ncbi:MAG: cell division protein FtsB, partial [Gammaproteobacteria bacterium]